MDALCATTALSVAICNQNSAFWGQKISGVNKDFGVRSCKNFRKVTLSVLTRDINIEMLVSRVIR